jgi:prepilin-type N-terminal cleavage/methylation domain-containing protein
MPKIIAQSQFSQYQTCKGFTLLEMLLVIALLGMMALTATALVDNVDEQSRFDVTKSRLEQIKRAIIGDSSRTLNGEPMINGYVADMGRLPNNIEELIEPVGTLWGAINISGVSGVVGQLYGGWRGPYLDVMPSSGPSAVRAFRDGWGNDDGAPNFGWNFTSGVNTLSVQSYGSGPGTGVYEVDYPSAGNLVEANDWQVDLSGVVFNLEFSKPPNDDINNLVMQIYSVSGSSFELFGESDVFGLSGVASVSGVQVAQALFDSDNGPLPVGIHAVVIMCVDVALEATRVFDGRVVGGTCDPSSTHAPYYLKVVPKAQLPSKIIWNIQ